MGSLKMEKRSLEDLDDNLTSLILEKLIGPAPKKHRQFNGFKRLATFARVSRRYSRIVNEQGAWESACRKFVPQLCDKMAPLEGLEGLGSGGWASFAKLLMWCPGYSEETENMELNELEPIEQNLSSQGPWFPASIAYRREILPDAKKCSKFFMLFCKHDECYTRRIGVDRIVFRGLVGSVEELAALSGFDFTSEDSQENHPKTNSQHLPFLSFPTAKIS